MNQIETIETPLAGLIGGAKHTLTLYRINGAKGGPHVHIQSSVHGAESQGNAVIFKLIDFFSKNEFNGSITFIPHANPISANHKVGTYTQGRFNGTTGENWNRIYTDISKDSLFNIEDIQGLSSLDFKKYLVSTLSKILERESKSGIAIEKKLGLTLQKIAAPADIVLDLHTGPVATRYLYVGEYAKEKSKDFPFPFKLIIPNSFAGAMDEACFMPWIAASSALGIQSKSHIPFESYTVELGSEEKISLKEAEDDAARILNLLYKRGLLLERPSMAEREETERSCLLDNYKSYYASKSGLVEYLKGPGAKVQKGEALCQLIDFSVLANGGHLQDCLIEITAQEDAYVINHNPSCNIQEGMMIYQLMTDYIE